MRSSYSRDDVIILLKDITGLVEPQSTEERERQIQSGRHYCEMLPVEYLPSQKYMEAYEAALENFSVITAKAVSVLAEKIMKSRGSSVVLVSLARAGIPAGILLKRYIKERYGIEVKHYAISIIRGRGIDENAVNYLLQRHSAEDILFVDGWTGKGAILGELKKSTVKYEGLSDELAVIADPANITELCGTHEDILIASSCLNSTVSGLISRTFLRDDIIGPDDFHGAVYYGEMKGQDLSYQFIDNIGKNFDFSTVLPKNEKSGENPVSEGCGKTQDCTECSKEKGLDEVKHIASEFGIDDINLVKPGIGEATRVLLRRVPWKILIAESCRNDLALDHIIRLAEEKNVPAEYYPLVHYKACGIIKNAADI